AWSRRRVADIGSVSRARLAQLLYRPSCFGRGFEIPGLSRSRFRALVGHSGVHQHRREHGRAADEGTDAAADELRALEPDRVAGMGGLAPARVSRGDDGEARFGDGAPALECVGRSGGRGACEFACAARFAGRRRGGGCSVSERPILVMAGGTGGHVFPALALARMLREKSIEVVWLGTQRGLEARIVPAAGIPIEWLSVGGLRGKGFMTLLAAPFRL